MRSYRSFYNPLGDVLDSDYAFCRRAFLPLDYLEFDLLPIGERAKALAPNSAVMHKDISTIGALDKAKTFSVVEPFDGSGRHRRIPWSIRGRNGAPRQRCRKGPAELRIDRKRKLVEMKAMAVAVTSAQRLVSSNCVLTVASEEPPR